MRAEGAFLRCAHLLYPQADRDADPLIMTFTMLVAVLGNGAPRGREHNE